MYYAVMGCFCSTTAYESYQEFATGTQTAIQRLIQYSASHAAAVDTGASASASDGASASSIADIVRSGTIVTDDIDDGDDDDIDDDDIDDGDDEDELF